MKHFALIGYPLGHSLSAKYFGEKFAREGIDADYTPLAIEKVEEVQRLLCSVRAELRRLCNMFCARLARKLWSFRAQGVLPT
jgi:shikimate 5-dehydrogenase